MFEQLVEVGPGREGRKRRKEKEGVACLTGA